MQGQLVDTGDLRLWALLAMCAAISASGTQPDALPKLPAAFWRRVRAISAAAEMLGAGLDLIDDIQDGDSPFVEEIGIPTALNIGLALIELAPLALDRARSAGWHDVLADAALKTMHISLLASLGGQFLDLRFEHTHAVSEAQILEMTGQKSGTLLSLICQLGAMGGSLVDQKSSGEYFEAMSQLGWHLGLWSQLLNDLRDAEGAQARSGKTDRRRHKKTLPLVLEEHGMMQTAPDVEKGSLPNLLAALSYTFIAAETIRLRATKMLQTIEAQFGPQPFLWPFLQMWEEA